jgi:hypothetical protein
VTTNGADRWVLRRLGPDQAPGADVHTIEHTVRVVDRASGMLLVEATEEQIGAVLATLPQWTATKEHRFSLAR